MADDSESIWAAIRRKLHAIGPQPIRLSSEGRVLPPTPPRADQIPTNDELCDALEQSIGQVIPYDMLSLVIARLRVAPTPGARGKRSTRVPALRWIYLTVLEVQRCEAHHSNKPGAREQGIRFAATHCAEAIPKANRKTAADREAYVRDVIDKQIPRLRKRVPDPDFAPTLDRWRELVGVPTDNNS